MTTAAPHRVLSPPAVREEQAAAMWAAAMDDVRTRLALVDAGHATVPAAVARCWRVLVAPTPGGAS